MQRLTFPIRLFIEGLLLLVLCGCGFQLNRNQPTLLYGAKSVYLEQMLNQSYRPGLDISLQQSVTQVLHEKKVLTGFHGNVGLTLTALIQTANYQKEDYTENVYKHRFQLTVSLSIKPPYQSQWPPISRQIVAEIVVENRTADLSETDIESGYKLAIAELAEKISSAIVADF